MPGCGSVWMPSVTRYRGCSFTTVFFIRVQIICYDYISVKAPVSTCNIGDTDINACSVDAFSIFSYGGGGILASCISYASHQYYTIHAGVARAHTQV